MNYDHYFEKQTLKDYETSINTIDTLIEVYQSRLNVNIDPGFNEKCKKDIEVLKCALDVLYREAQYLNKFIKEETKA